MLWILADADPISGTAVSGWAGAGLLGLVLAWLLLKHIPKVFDDQKEERTNYRETLDKLVNKSEEDRKTFQAVIQNVLTHSKEDTTRVVEAVGKITQSVRDELKEIHRKNP